MFFEDFFAVEFGISVNDASNHIAYFEVFCSANVVHEIHLMSLPYVCSLKESHYRQAYDPQMVPRLSRTLLKFLLLIMLFLSIIYVRFIWRVVSLHLKAAFYHYGEVFSGDSRDGHFKKMYDELLTLEKFSAPLKEPEEAIIFPAWLEKHRVRSNDRTMGKETT